MSKNYGDLLVIYLRDVFEAIRPNMRSLTRLGIYLKAFEMNYRWFKYCTLLTETYWKIY